MIDSFSFTSRSGKNLNDMGVDTNTKRQCQYLPDSRAVLHKKGYSIDQFGFYIIEISSEKEFLHIAAFSVTGPQSYLITQKGQTA
jgi:hypothetical protein